MGREFLLTERKQRSAYVSGSGVPRREDCAKTHQKVRNNILFSYQPPPRRGGRVANRPILGSQTPNSWSPAGRANSREFQLSRPRPQIPSNQANSGPRPETAQFIFGKPTPYRRAFWQSGQFSPRGKADFPRGEAEFGPNGGISV